jgi:hypothetical protein
MRNNSKLWNRGSTAGGGVWHREVPGRSVSASSSLASLASTAATGSSSNRQSPTSLSLPLQQQQPLQHPSSKHRPQKSKLLPAWLVSFLFKAEKRYWRIFIMLVAIFISFWISHYIVSTWPATTTTSGKNAAYHNNKALLFGSSEKYPNQHRQQQRRRDDAYNNNFVGIEEEEDIIVIRLDDLENAGGLPAPLPDHRLGKRRDFGGIDNLRILEDDVLPRRLHHHVEDNVNNYIKPGDGDDEVDW